jgi:hypothetical protein
VGVVKGKLNISEPSISAIEATWQRQATAAAIKAARDVVKFDGAIPPGTQIGRLSDTEWGWIAAAIIFAWISMRAEQATAEGLHTELTVRVNKSRRGEPWDAGAIATILLDLFAAIEEWQGAMKIDWTVPVQDWSRQQMVDFLLCAFYLIRDAMTARDVGGGSVTNKPDNKVNDPNTV